MKLKCQNSIHFPKCFGQLELHANLVPVNEIGVLEVALNNDGLLLGHLLVVLLMNLLLAGDL